MFLNRQKGNMLGNRSDRAANQDQAEAEVAAAVVEIVKRRQLTVAETCAVLCAVLSRWVGRQVRDERGG